MSKNMRLTPAALGAALDGDLANFLVAATPGGIEAQEAAGQRDLCANGARLPKDTDPCVKVLEEKLGFKFNGSDDNLFYNVTLPAGWKIVPTEHSMWSDLNDDKGRKRAGLFYKAAFYDRSAHIRFDRRYYVGVKYLGDDVVYQIIDNADPKNPLAETEPVNSRQYTLADQKRAEMKTELTARFPQYEDVLAYW